MDYHDLSWSVFKQIQAVEPPARLYYQALVHDGVTDYLIFFSRLEVIGGALAHYSFGTETRAELIADFEANFRANAHPVASEADAHALGGQGLAPKEVTP